MEQKKRFKKAVRCFASSSWARPGQMIPEEYTFLNPLDFRETDYFYFTHTLPKLEAQKRETPKLKNSKADRLKRQQETARMMYLNAVAAGRYDVASEIKAKYHLTTK